MGIEYVYECNFTEELVCPNCGFIHEECYRLEKDNGNTNCSSCLKSFGYTREITVTYSTWEINEK